MRHIVLGAVVDLADSSKKSAHWSLLGRFGFRFVFVFLPLSIAVTFSPYAVLPFVGPKLGDWTDTLATGAAHWAAVHIVHLSGIAAQDHPTDSRDTALGWITAGAVLVFSILSALLWSILDRKRPHYQTAAAWLRFILRMCLVFLMLRYGIFKIFPLQMSRPSLAVLNEPLGSSSPMTLLWTLIGLHPAYQILCGLVEALVAVLIFFRRTALLGACLGAFVMTNVLIYNLFFDVPVKLGAALILFALLAVIAPDLRSLYAFFWLHMPSAPNGIWVPPQERVAFKRATRFVEIAFLCVSLYAFIPNAFRDAKQERESLRHPSAIAGAWHVDSALLTTGGRTVVLPILTAEGSPMTALYLEPDGRAMARSDDGRLWRAGASINLPRHTLTLFSGYFEGTRFQASYQVDQPDANHLILKPTADEAGSQGILALTRIPLPTTYPLLDRQYHWVNEWALER